MAEINYEIVEELGVLSTASSGWRKELNYISWNEGKPKFDIRQWGPDHSRVGKGISLNREEAKALLTLLKGLLEE